MPIAGSAGLRRPLLDINRLGDVGGVIDRVTPSRKHGAPTQSMAGMRRVILGDLTRNRSACWNPSVFLARSDSEGIVAWHDSLAATARRNSRHSGEFHAAAQKYANAFWLWLISIGVVWYFFGWAWSLVPGVLLISAVVKSSSATMVATRLERYESEDTDGGDG